MHTIDKSSLQSWLSSELEQYGIDSNLYARHILDLFLNSGYTTDLLLNKREKNIFSLISECPKKSSKLKRKAESRSAFSLTSDETVWKKNMAVKRLLAAADDDIAASNENKIKELIEKLHNLIMALSDTKLNGASDTKKKPKENYNDAFPRLACVPVKALPTSATVWDNYNSSKNRESTVTSFSQRYSSNNLKVVTNDNKNNLKSNRNNKPFIKHGVSSQVSQSRLSNRVKRHPYVKKKQNLASKQYRKSPKHVVAGKAGEKRIRDGKPLQTTSDSANFNGFNENDKTKNRFSYERRNDVSSSGFSKKVCNKLGINPNLRKNKNRNSKNSQIQNGSTTAVASKSSNLYLNSANQTSHKRLPLFRRFCKNSKYNAGIDEYDEDLTEYSHSANDVMPFYPTFSKDKFVYPSYEAYKKAAEVSFTSDQDIWNHYYLPVSMSSDFTTESPNHSSKWFRDPQTGLLKFIPARHLFDEDTKDLSNFNEKVEMWKYCPSPNLWKDQTDETSGGRVSRLERIYNNPCTESLTKDQVVDNDWQRYQAIFTEISSASPGPNAITSTSDHDRMLFFHKRPTQMTSTDFCLPHFSGSQMMSCESNVLSQISNNKLKNQDEVGTWFNDLTDQYYEKYFPQYSVDDQLLFDAENDFSKIVSSNKSDVREIDQKAFLYKPTNTSDTLQTNSSSSNIQFNCDQIDSEISINQKFASTSMKDQKLNESQFSLFTSASCGVENSSSDLPSVGCSYFSNNLQSNDCEDLKLCQSVKTESTEAFEKAKSQKDESYTGDNKTQLSKFSNNNFIFPVKIEHDFSSCAFKEPKFDDIFDKKALGFNISYLQKILDYDYDDSIYGVIDENVCKKSPTKSYYEPLETKEPSKDMLILDYLNKHFCEKTSKTTIEKDTNFLPSIFESKKMRDKSCATEKESLNRLPCFQKMNENVDKESDKENSSIPQADILKLVLSSVLENEDIVAEDLNESFDMVYNFSDFICHDSPDHNRHLDSHDYDYLSTAFLFPISTFECGSCADRSESITSSVMFDRRDWKLCSSCAKKEQNESSRKSSSTQEPWQENFAHIFNFINLFNFGNLTQNKDSFNESFEVDSNGDILEEINDTIKLMNSDLTNSIPTCENSLDDFNKDFQSQQETIQMLYGCNEMFLFLPTTCNNSTTDLLTSSTMSSYSVSELISTSESSALMECVNTNDAWKTRVRISNMWESVSGIRPVDIIYNEKESSDELISLQPSALTHFRPISSYESSNIESGSTKFKTSTDDGSSISSGDYSSIYSHQSWLDLSLLKRDNQNVNVDGINFPCSTCEPGNIENEINDLLKSNDDKQSCNCKKKSHQDFRSTSNLSQLPLTNLSTSSNQPRSEDKCLQTNFQIQINRNIISKRGLKSNSR